MKKAAKRLVAGILGWQTRRLRKKNDFKVIAVAGSVGKTSTKLAIARVLSQRFNVQFQDGNYNDTVSVPLIFFDRRSPRLFNPLAWLAVFIKNEITLFKQYPYDVVVVELGTAHPGELKKFKKYLSAEIGVLTAIAPEHMEYFKDLDSVAKEELTLAELSTLTLINKDMTDAKYLGVANSLTYGINNKSDFSLTNITYDNDGCNFEALAGNSKIFEGKHEAFSEPQLYSILAAIAVSYKLGFDAATIQKGLARINPVAGRMRRLNGINGSTIIDDTYNASPEAVKAALKTLYRLNASQKIALLGNMNELGKFSEDAHREIGKLCDPKQLDLVVTLGPDANKYLAEEARKQGCRVQQFDNPYKAGEYLKSQVKADCLILVKGSQNMVFAEEAVKLLLADPADSSKLVRQSPRWLRAKKREIK